MPPSLLLRCWLLLALSSFLGLQSSWSSPRSFCNSSIYFLYCVKRTANLSLLRRSPLCLCTSVSSEQCSWVLCSAGKGNNGTAQTARQALHHGIRTLSFGNPACTE